MTGGSRFERPGDFIDEMGPQGVTFIQYAHEAEKPDSRGQIIATAGCKPFSIAFGLDERARRFKEERAARESSGATHKLSGVADFYTEANEEQLLQQAENSGPMVHTDGQDEVPRWEIMTVCVNPEMQKQGLAEDIIHRVLEEVGTLVANSGQGPHFKLVVRTLKEINEQYWTRKGFKTVGEKFFEPGLFGSPTGFHIIDMTRDHSTIDGRTV
ncbi:MAG: hypothetical protein Q9183_007297 [Haloplaca sp. 2 TL-2023]